MSRILNNKRATVLTVQTADKVLIIREDNENYLAPPENMCVGAVDYCGLIESARFISPCLGSRSSNREERPQCTSRSWFARRLQSRIIG
ncbi:hypothetical protein BMS3Bbin04_01618 [bacterium BMS3Bbin04]|nr:hypothetical protein BMS3Bbin04_01618 [bacterium BMS3Bbin04]